MTTIHMKDNSIVIEEEKKRFFSSKTKTIIREVFLDDIEEVRRDEFEGVFNSLGLHLKNGQEEFFVADECFDLEKVYQFFVEQRNNGRQIRIFKIDIETLEETEL